MKKLLLLALVLVSAGCGPAYRYRAPEILDRGDVEVGVGLGAAGIAGVESDPASPGRAFGGAEFQLALRGAAGRHAEVGSRFWSHSFNTLGGAFELRLQPVKEPVAFSIDLGLMAEMCCTHRSDEEPGARALTVGGAFDVGLTIGGRIGGALGPAPYFAPHFQVGGLPVPGLDPVQDRPKLLYLPVGVDIPLGSSPFRLRPEFLTAILIRDTIAPEVRIGGGMGVVLRGPGPAKARRQRQEGQEEGATSSPQSD